MTPFILQIIASLALLVSAQNSSTSEIIPLLEKANLVPKILPTFSATVGPLVITYPNGIVNYGNNLSVSVVTYAPTVQFPAEAAYPDYKYVYAIIDPDAPTPAKSTEADIRHYLVADVSPSTSAVNLSTYGNVLSAYKSPAPPAGSPAHRYTSVLLRQPLQANISLYNQSASKSNFNFTLFRLQNSLTIVSANYFNASAVTASSTSSATGSSGTSGSTKPSSSSSSTTVATTSGAIDARSLPFSIMLMGLLILAI